MEDINYAAPNQQKRGFILIPTNIHDISNDILEGIKTERASIIHQAYEKAKSQKDNDRATVEVADQSVS